MSDYMEKLKDPRWQKKRLEILERDNWTCQSCSDKENTLHVHHKAYIKGKDPWDYPDDMLITLCKECHEGENYASFEIGKDIADIFRRYFSSQEMEDFVEHFSILEYQKNSMGKSPKDILTVMTAFLHVESFQKDVIALYNETFKPSEDTTEVGWYCLYGVIK